MAFIHSFIHSSQFLGAFLILGLHWVKGKRSLLHRQAEGVGQVNHQLALMNVS